MRIGLISSAVPLVGGGYRFIVEWLCQKLRERGHDVEILYLPTTEEMDWILPQMAAISSIKLDDYYERVITFRPPAHMIHHPRKVVWFIHHIRPFYDLWDSPYRHFADNAANRSLRDAIKAADTKALAGAHKLFTNSNVVSERVRNFNGLSSETLYPPILDPDSFRSGDYGDEIVCICRLEGGKRQHLLLEALAISSTRVRLRLCGASQSSYANDLKMHVERLGLADRVSISEGWISEQEKVNRLETALAAVYIPFDEDSYGYPTLEAAHADRCTITTTDSGGVLEFVLDSINGFAVEPTASALASAFDRLYNDRSLARHLGRQSKQRIDELGVNWDTVISKLLG